MKRIVSILLIAILALSICYAKEDQISVTLTVDPVLIVGFTNTSEPHYDDQGQTITSGDAGDSVSYDSFSDGSGIYAFVRTNYHPDMLDYSIDATALTRYTGDILSPTFDENHKIKLTLRNDVEANPVFSEKTFDTAASNTSNKSGDPIKWQETASDDNQKMRNIPIKLGVEADPTDLGNAVEGNYVAYLTFTVSTT